jgi:hypothetical protein
MNLMKSESLQVKEELLHLHAKRVTIDDERLCLVCRKQMRNTAFYCYPNGVVVHHGCATNPYEVPQPGSGASRSSRAYDY